jgi:hypothetical protein
MTMDGSSETRDDTADVPVSPWPAAAEHLGWSASGRQVYCAPDGLHMPRGQTQERTVGWEAIRRTSVKTHDSWWSDYGGDGYDLLVEVWLGTTEVVKPFGSSGLLSEDEAERAMQSINKWRDCWQALQSTSS